MPYKALLNAGVPFYAVLGNHDMTNERFYKPLNMNGANYYSYKKGHVRFFALDSNYMDPKQTAWIETQLRDAGKGDWKICYFHHPLYSSARTHGPATALRKVLEPLFVKYGVDVVLAGHEHVYERVLPQQGVYYFTEGASGQLRAGDLAPSAITARGFDADRSFMLIEIAGDDLYFQAIADGPGGRFGVITALIRPAPDGAARDYRSNHPCMSSTGQSPAPWRRAIPAGARLRPPRKGPCRRPSSAGCTGTGRPPTT